MAFDLVSKEYGWTDEQIMDLPLVRLRQITAAINRRNYWEQRREQNLTSWMTRQLASFIAAGYMTDGKSENKALKAAQMLAFDEIERLQLLAAEHMVDDRPRGQSAQEPARGSAERFMRTFGSPSRWR